MLKKSNLGTVITLIGVAAVTAGAVLIAIPLGFIVGGASFAYIGYRMGG